MDLKNKTYEELHELRRNSVPGGEVFEQVTKEIERIQQDTNNIQIAKLIGEVTELKNIANDNAQSSNKLATRAIVIAVIGILISVGMGIIHIKLAYIQATPVFDSLAKEEKRALSFCLQSPESEWTLPSDATTTCRAILGTSGLLLDQKINILELLLSTSTDRLLY